MDFLYKNRVAEKRTIKSFDEAQHLEALILEDESYDSDLRVGKTRGKKVTIRLGMWESGDSDIPMPITTSWMLIPRKSVVL